MAATNSSPTSSAASPAGAPRAGRAARHVSVHELPESTWLRYRAQVDAKGEEDRKVSAVFLTSDGSVFTNAVVFKDLAAKVKLKGYRNGQPMETTLAQLQPEDKVSARELSQLQTRSVQAFRNAYGTEDWVISDWRAWAACCHIANAIRPVKYGEESVLWKKHRRGCESFDKLESDQYKLYRHERRATLPLEFRLVGHGTKEEGEARFAQLGRRHPRAEKFDIEIRNPNTGKSVFLEVSGNNLVQYEMSTLLVQESKMAYAVANPERLNVFALVNRFDHYKNKHQPDLHWREMATTYLVLNKRSAERNLGVGFIENKSHISEKYLRFAANSSKHQSTSDLLRSDMSDHFFKEIISALENDDGRATLRLSRGRQDGITPAEEKVLHETVRPPQHLIEMAFELKKKRELERAGPGPKERPARTPDRSGR